MHLSSFWYIMYESLSPYLIAIWLVKIINQLFKNKMIVFPFSGNAMIFLTLFFIKWKEGAVVHALIFVCRKGLNGSIASKLDASHDYFPTTDNGEIDVANLVLKLLPSKDGVVLRRLLMTAVSYTKPALHYIKRKQYTLCQP